MELSWGWSERKKNHEIMMVMMILFTAIKILSFYGKQNRNALQHKKKCIDSKYALFALRNRCAISTLTTMSMQCCSDEDPANLQQDMYII